MHGASEASLGAARDSMNDRHQERSEDSDVQRSDADDAPRDPDGVGEASINVFGDIVERRKRVWQGAYSQKPPPPMLKASTISSRPVARRPNS